MLPFPAISPVAFEIGPLAVRWYALAYIAGVLLGWRYARYLAQKIPRGPVPAFFDDVVSWIILGILLGGRLGYVLFYNLDYYIQNPLDALMLWHGGMAFHGGLIGAAIATWLFARANKTPFLALADILACAAPIGLFFGRLANFVNGELFGRTTDAPWGILFPRGGAQLRHPSQLYEAGLEGLLLFIILGVLARQPRLAERRGLLSGTFLIFYALFRSTAEFFREPDVQIGFLAGGMTMGQILSLPMLLLGVALLTQAKKHDTA